MSTECPLIPRCGMVLRGRFGKYTGGTSPEWQDWQDHTLDWANGQFIAIGDFEAALDHQYDNIDGRHILEVDGTYFEFEMPCE